MPVLPTEATMKPEPYLVTLSEPDRILTPGEQAQVDLIRVDLIMGRARLVPRRPLVQVLSDLSD